MYHIDMFKEEISLKEIALDIFIGLPFYYQSREHADSVLPFINIKDLEEGALHPQELEYFSFRNVPDIRRYTVYPDDVVLTSRGTKFKVAVIPEKLSQAVISYNLMAIRVNPDRILPEYVAAYLKTSHGQKKIFARVTSSHNTQIVLSVSNVADIKIPVPALDIQRKIVQAIKALETQYAVGIESARLARAMQNQIILDTVHKI